MQSHIPLRSIAMNLGPQVYIYIPFSVTENNIELWNRAVIWAKNMSLAKPDKVPTIIMHKPSHENDPPSPQFSNVKFRFSCPDTIPENSVIYVTAHGMGDPFLIASNQDGNNFSTISMTEVADRMKKDGFTPELAKKVKDVRLFICDKNGMNVSLAYNFAEGLGEEYNELKIGYYEAKVAFPKSLKDSKLEGTIFDSYDPSVENTVMKVAAKKLPSLQYCFIGRASEFKKYIKAGDVFSKRLSQKKTPQKQDTCFGFLTLFYDCLSSKNGKNNNSKQLEDAHQVKIKLE